MFASKSRKKLTQADKAEAHHKEYDQKMRIEAEERRKPTPQRIAKPKPKYDPAPMPSDDEINAALAQIRRSRP